LQQAQCLRTRSVSLLSSSCVLMAADSVVPVQLYATVMWLSVATTIELYRAGWDCVGLNHLMTRNVLPCCGA
jgi:hypothetical protein